MGSCPGFGGPGFGCPGFARSEAAPLSTGRNLVEPFGRGVPAAGVLLASVADRPNEPKIPPKGWMDCR